MLVFHAVLGPDSTQIERILHKPVFELSAPYDLWAKFWVTLFSGDSAVILFFMLSGCVLVQSLDRDLSRYPPAKTALAFTVRRILRIYPAAIVNILAMVAAVWIHKQIVPELGWPYSQENILLNLALYSPDVNGATWTLFVELAAVPFLIVVAMLARLYGWPALIGFLVYAVIARNEPWMTLGSEWTAQFLYYFAFGCMVGSTVGLAASRLASRAGWIVLLGLFIVLPQLRPYLGFKAALLQAFCGFLFLCLIYHRPPARLTAFLMRPVSQYLGRVSYGFYLWHAFFIMLLIRTLYLWPDFSARHAVEIGLAASVPIAILTALVADLSERYVEQPGIRLGGRVSRRILDLGRPGPQAVRTVSREPA